jgi:mRNA interferase MazF
VVARGEVWWHEHPTGGARPHLILTRNEAIPLLHQVIAIPTTRTIRGIPTEVALDETDGMPGPCVLALDNIGLIRHALCTSLITTLSAQKLRDVCEALRLAVAC